MKASTLQKQARLAERDGDNSKAKALYEEIIEAYPDSEEAAAARVDLEEVKAKQEAAAAEQPSEKVSPAQKNEPIVLGGNVTVTDIKMPFWSMVVFMIKAALASIPAVIILTIIFTFVLSVLGGFGGVLGRGMHR